MDSRTLGTLLAGLLGLALLVFIWGTGASQKSVISIAGAALCASGFAGFLAAWIAPALLERIRRTWDLKNIEFAPYLLANRIRKNAKIEEVLIIAYTSKVVHLALKPLADKHCTIKRIRILLKNPEDIWNMYKTDYAIPSNKQCINRRMSDMEDHLLGDILSKRKGMGIATNVEVRFYHGHPVLRAMIIDGKIGFLSIYTQRDPFDEGIDWSASDSKVLLVSDDVPYRKLLLNDVKKWFRLMWENGTTSVPDRQHLAEIISRRYPQANNKVQQNTQ